jgi:predicted RND superfamily exporter protein
MLLAAKAVLVLLVILLYSDYSRRLINRFFERRRDTQHDTAAQHDTANQNDTAN